jgi:beta-glucosidase
LGPQVKMVESRTGLTFIVYNEDHTVSTREVIDFLIVVDSNMFLADYKNSKIKGELWYAGIEGYLTPEEDGEYKFGVSVYGTAKLFVGGKLVVDNATKQSQGTTFFGSGSVEEKGTIPVKKGQKYHILVEFGSGATSKLRTEGIVVFGGGIRLGGCPKIKAEDEIARAASLAKEGDQVIVCTGLNVRILISNL